MRSPEFQSPRFRTRLAALCLISGAALIGCGGGDHAPVDNRVTVSKSEFDSSACMHWETYGAKDGNYSVFDIKPLDLLTETNGNGYAVSSAPWWVDPNHAPPGAGYLNLVAVGYYEGWRGESGEVQALSSGKPLDLRNADVSVRWRAPTLALAPNSKLVFWFQTRAFDPVTAQIRYVNYALTGQPLVAKKDDATWQTVNLKLRTDPTQWTCLGSSTSRAATYGCARSIDEALANFEADLGFVIVSPDESSSQGNTGAVEFDAFSMLIPPENLDTHANTVSYLNTESNTCNP